jgi:small subunit ribosomal protein S21
MLRIEVKNGNIDQALKKYKSKVIKTKQMKELRDNQDYIKPTTKNRMKKQKALRIKKWNKQNKQA